MGRQVRVAELMQNETFLVSPEGRWLPEGSPEFLREVGDLDPDYDAAMFAVKNLGFIKVEIITELVVSITLHPSNVDLNSLIAVNHVLSKSTARAFCIRFLTTRWEREILPNAERAFERLHDLYSLAHLEDHRSSERFSAVRQDHERILSNDEHRLRPILQKWRMAFGQFDDTVLPFMARHGFLRRTVVVGVQPNDPDPVFRYVGDAFDWLGDRDFAYRAIGEKVTNQPDREYGQWVAEDYRQTALRKLPQLDKVNAALRGRSGRTVYDRLLLPWATRSSEILVTVSSLVTEGATAALAPALTTAGAGVAEAPAMPSVKKVAKSS
jgi:hypothetical protein